MFGALFLAVVAYGASTFTTNYNLENPADGDTSWGSAMRSNMTAIDTQMKVNETSISWNTARARPFTFAPSVPAVVSFVAMSSDAYAIRMRIDPSAIDIITSMSVNPWRLSCESGWRNGRRLTACPPSSSMFRQESFV